MIGNRLWGGLSGPYDDCAAGLTGASQAKAALCQAWWSATTALLRRKRTSFSARGTQRGLIYRI